MLGLLLAALSAASSVSASCGTAACPSEPFAGTAPSGRWTSLGYEFDYTPADEVRVLRHPAVPGEVRGHHDESFTVSRVHRLVAALGWGHRFALEGRIPWVSRSHGHIHNHRGQKIGEGWDFDGLGDIELAARLGAAGSPEGRAGLLSFIGGVKLHTGEEHRMSETGGEADIGVQPGSGSTDVFFGAGWNKDQGLWGRTFPLRARVSYRVNGPGREEYRIGNVTQAGVGFGVPLAAGLSVTAGAELAVRERDYKGRTTEETQKTGGESVSAAPGLAWAGGGWEVSTAVRLPVYRRVNSIQLTAPWSLSAALTRRFSL